MKVKLDIIKQNKDIEVAMRLINYGARLQMLECETQVKRSLLVKLHRELLGLSPAKGLLPFSTDWFIIWENNIHASIFYSIYANLIKLDPSRRVEVIIKAYRLYIEQCQSIVKDTPLLSITRAWILVRFFEGDMLHQSTCTLCEGNFVTHSYQPKYEFLCSFCRTPSRAIKL